MSMIGEIDGRVYYLNKTSNLCLTLNASNVGVIKWYKDESYVIHDDAKVQLKVFHVKKWNAKSSTEAELIRVDEALPQLLWMQYFLEHQGCTITYIT